MNANQVIVCQIRSCRRGLDYSQDYVAHKLQMSQANYSKLESGKIKIDLDLLFKISLVLERDPVQFVDDCLAKMNAAPSKGSSA